MKKYPLLAMSIFLIVALLVSCAPAAPQAAATQAPATGKQYVMVTVVKSIAFNWFKRMEVGVNQFGKDNGVKASMQGPSQADSAAQVAMIEDLIAAAINDARAKADQAAAVEMQKMQTSLPLPPGFKLPF